MARQADYPIVNVENVQYTGVAAGECIAGTARSVMGTAPSRLVWIRANITNSGTIYVGGAGVTAEDGTADATSGMPLAAGEQFGPIPVADVNLLSVIASAVNQRAAYFAVS